PSSPLRHPELVSGSMPPPTRRQRFKAQPHRQVRPMRVLAFDQVDLPLPMPALELLLAQDRPFHVVEHLVADEPVDLVSACESPGDGFAVLISRCIRSLVTPM